MACATSLGVAGSTRFDPGGHCAVGAEALLMSPGRDETSTDLSKNLVCIPRKFLPACPPLSGGPPVSEAYLGVGARKRPCGEDGGCF